ncbi:bifunctional homocysteine S-methyltransferase/methylenetetrahydrofolate reductase [Deltaproteobacteria bacterium]|nr:bifunctional homocysteine S-methyltransferase/methylenetetrahydrofolate reductase [Deltaproteobacteria bacterium]
MPELSFREALSQRVLLFDGAMGTEIYARGVFINRCYDELNVSQADTVGEIHSAYVRAGADVVTTNTFGANRIRLGAYGLETRAKEINATGVRLARAAAKDKAWVAGSMGPTGALLAPVGKVAPGEAYQAFREQAEVLIDAGADLIVLETFTHLAELWQAVRAVRSVNRDQPIVAAMSFPFIGPDQMQIEGDTPETAARTVSGWGIDAFGTNCSNGPRGVQHVLERMVNVTNMKLVAMPNAGLPQVVEGRTLYLAAPEYMAEHARRFVQLGAGIVGGCCGTTPEMIKQMRSYVRSVTAERRTIAVEAGVQNKVPVAEPKPIAERSEFARRLYGGKFCVSVELDPPRGVDAQKAVEGAAMLLQAGIDVVNIADGPRAVARMGPSALAQLVRAHCPMESVVHYCCRDRNLLGMQMDLLGANALGLRNILAVTGDPPKMGTYPDATAVFDIDAIGLISFIQMLNRGLDFSGQPVGGQTALFVGAGCNPAHIDLDIEVARFGRKIEAGAEFFFSQPVFDPAVLLHFLERTDSFKKVPFLVGIMPLVSLRNAEFLHNEVPGMQVPSVILDRLRNAGDRDAQREVGIQCAQEALREVMNHPRIAGTYVYPPFGSYKAVLRVVEVLKDRTGPTHFGPDGWIEHV